MPRKLTMDDVCEITTNYALRTGDFTRFEAWIIQLRRDQRKAEDRVLLARSSMLDRWTIRKYQREFTEAQAAVKAMEAAHVAAWTERNRMLFAAADAAAKTA